VPGGASRLLRGGVARQHQTYVHHACRVFGGAREELASFANRFVQCARAFDDAGERIDPDVEVGRHALSDRSRQCNHG
jgi:hypothetical protein